MRAYDYGSLSWIDKDGRGHTLHAMLGTLILKLQTLRAPATLRKDGSDEPIGGCARAEGHDDKRIKWNWWYDADAELVGSEVKTLVTGTVTP